MITGIELFTVIDCKDARTKVFVPKLLKVVTPEDTLYMFFTSDDFIVSEETPSPAFTF